MCQPCLRMTPRRLTAATQCDHIVERADGGGEEDANLQAICDDCQNAKTKAAQALRRVGLSSVDLGAPWVRHGGAPADPGGVGHDSDR